MSADERRGPDLTDFVSASPKRRESLFAIPQRGEYQRFERFAGEGTDRSDPQASMRPEQSFTFTEPAGNEPEYRNECHWISTVSAKVKRAFFFR